MANYSPNSSASSCSSTLSSPSSSLLEFQWMERSIEAMKIEEVSTSSLEPFNRMADKGLILDASFSDHDEEQQEMYEMEKLLERNVSELTNLTELTGMPLVQENGQRRFGPLPGSRAPAKGSEVFVGKLPKLMNESHVYALFRHAGEINQIRLMLDFNGSNRGFCFVQYYRPEDARHAIATLNHFEIAEGRRIGVTGSVDNCRLFIGGIPKDKTEQEIFFELGRVTDNLVKIFARPSKTPSPSSDENRGFAFAEYASHRDAAMARRKMLPGKISLWGKAVHVDWAEPDQPEAVNRNYGAKSQTQKLPGGRFFNLFDKPIPQQVGFGGEMDIHKIQYAQGQIQYPYMGKPIHYTQKPIHYAQKPIQYAPNLIQYTPEPIQCMDYGQKWSDFWIMNYGVY